MNSLLKRFLFFVFLFFVIVACKLEQSLSSDTALINTEEISTQETPQNSSSVNFPTGWTSYTNANEVTDVAFDQSGYLWAASVGGVTRWNLGKGNYERYTVENGLPSNNITAIQPAIDGSVWVGTQFGKIARLVKQKWQTYDIPELSRRMKITDIHQDKDGNIWFATYGAGAIKYDGKNWKVYLIEDGMASVVVYGIAEDADGNLWFETRIPCCASLDGKNVHDLYGTENGIKPGVSKFDGEKWEIYFDELGLGEDDFTYHRYSLGTNGNDLWLSSALSREIMLYDGDELIRYPYDISFYNPVTKILADNGENLWFVVYGQGVIKFDGLDWITYDEQNGIISNKVTAIAIEADGSICLGTEQGIACLDNNEWQVYRTTDAESSLPSRHINDLVQDSDGVIWLATNQGVVSFNGEVWNEFTTDDGLPGNDIRDVSANSGKVWIRSLQNITDTISSYDGSKWTAYDFGDIGRFIDFAQDGSFWSWNDNDGFLKLYSDQGVEIYSDGKFWSPDKVIVSPDNHVWVYATGAANPDDPMGIFRYDGQIWSLPYQADAWTTGMALSPDGKIWRASSVYDPVGGLGFYQFDGSEWVLVTVLLDKTHIHEKSMVFSSDGTLWVGCSEDGIYKYSGSEWLNYSIQDGLSGEDVRAIYVSSDDVFWFVTEGGLTRYEPSNKE